jgi:hypothetical protein
VTAQSIFQFNIAISPYQLDLCKNLKTFFLKVFLLSAASESTPLAIYRDEALAS